MFKIVKESNEHSERYNALVKIKNEIYGLTDLFKEDGVLLSHLGRLKDAIDDITNEQDKLDTVPGYSVGGNSSELIEDVLLNKMSSFGFKKFSKNDFYGYDMERNEDGSLPLIASLYLNSYNDGDSADILVNDKYVAVELFENDDDAGELTKFSSDINDIPEIGKFVVDVMKNSTSIDEVKEKLRNNEFRINH